MKGLHCRGNVSDFWKVFKFYPYLGGRPVQKVSKFHLCCIAPIGWSSDDRLSSFYSFLDELVLIGNNWQLIR